MRVTTLGPQGSLIERSGEPAIRVRAMSDVDAADPTGVGDGYRAGFLAGVAWKLPLDRAAQLGSLLAAYVLETIGTQEYEVDTEDVLRRMAQAYGDTAAADLEAHLPA